MKDKATILAVDDTPELLCLLAEILTEAGYTVFSVSSGEEALATVDEVRPDLILTDIRMMGIDGLEVCRRLKSDEKTRGIPIILISAFAAVEEWVEGLRSGAADYINKPFHPAELLARVKAHIELSRAIVSLEQQTTKLRRTNEQLQSEIEHRRRVEEELRCSLESVEISRRALQASEEWHRTILQTAMDGFWMVDSKGRLQEVNETHCRMSGYSAQELLSMNVCDLDKSRLEDEVFAHRQRLIERGEDRFEIQHLRKDGSTFDVELSVQYRPSNGGKFVAFLRDITEKKQVEARLQQAQKLESIGTLAGGIAHDFNNILYPLLGFAELLKEDIPADSPWQEHIDEILRATLRSKDLVKQILAFSRKGDRNAKPVRLQSIVSEAIPLLRSSIPTTIDIRHDVTHDCGIVNADPTQIHQIILNLATNAFHAMEDTGGRLSIRLKQVRVEVDQTGSPSLSPGDYALLTVADTGTGIEKHIMDKIFDPYFTTKGVGKGTGLGLSVVHGIVKAYKGDIRVFSYPGKGTTVEVYLPIIERTIEIKQADDSLEIRGGTERILLVDDEEVVVRLEKEILDRFGYQVEIRFSSIDALQVFKAKPNSFDLVITDMTMPNMTGDLLAKAMIAIRPDIPIVLCTGFSQKIDPDKARASGIKGFLLKPIVKTDMARTVRKVLDEAKR